MAIFGEKLLTSASRYREACAFVNATWGTRAQLGEEKFLEKVQEKLADEEPMHLSAMADNYRIHTPSEKQKCS